MVRAEGQYVKGIQGEEEQKAFSGNSMVKSQHPYYSCFVDLKLATALKG